MPKFMLAVALIVVLSQVAAPQLRADEAEQVKKITELLTAQQAAPAEEAFQAALKEFPDSQKLKAFRVQLYVAQIRAGNAELASEHAVAHFEDQLQRFNESPATASLLPSAVQIATSALQRIKKADAAVAITDRSLSAVDAQLKKESTPGLSAARNQLCMSKVMMLMRIDRAGDATPLLKEELADATREFTDHPDDVAALLRLVQWRDVEISVVSEVNPEGAPALVSNQLELLSEQFRKNSTDERVIAAFINSSQQAIRGLISTNPDEAGRRLTAFREIVESIDAKPIDLKRHIDRAKQSISQLERMIEAESKRLALIGKPAIPLDVEAWVNGEPLTPGDLAGKVVLIDFWAVWCGPCIATFPHLREWKEKYGSGGLVVIGATRYYQYDWDDEGKKIKADKQLTPEQEQAALVRFAAHHELKHRFAVVPKESDFQTAYGVTGIPQVVLIDRAGMVRMIRVGSGDKNAHDLEAMIKKLLAEPGETP